LVFAIERLKLDQEQKTFKVKSLTEFNLFLTLVNAGRSFR
jgi:hypothetical protein